jgi:hypothetical protein
LTTFDVDFVRGKADGVIAVSDAIDLAPWADVLYSCDGGWWGWPKGQAALKTFQGLKYALKDDAKKWAAYGVQRLRHTGRTGLELSPDGLKDGANSGYQAINLAVHLGAARIVLLGYDMQGTHFFGQHPDGSKPTFSVCLPLFQTLVKPLAAAGIEVINCSRKTAITCFRRESLEAVFAERPAQVAV